VPVGQRAGEVNKFGEDLVDFDVDGVLAKIVVKRYKESKRRTASDLINGSFSNSLPNPSWEQLDAVYFITHQELNQF
jgi:hypothetical protein